MPRAQLLELYAHGLGVIEDARLEFGPGFNVVTGETGAGKTLLLGALGLSLGLDAGVSRYALGPDTRAAALFSVDGEERLFSRESSGSGRLRSSMNGAPSSAEALRTMAREVIVIHGQHDSLALRNPGEVVRLIDTVGGVDTSALESIRERLRAARRQRDTFGGDAGARERELEFLDFQLSELEAARLDSPDELDAVLAELTRLSALRDGQAALEEVRELFDAEGDDAVLVRFAHALSRLPADAAYDGVRAVLNGALVQAREALHDLAALANPDAFDPSVIDALNERARVLQQVARKYGGSLAAAIDTRERLAAEVIRLRHADAALSALDQEIQNLEHDHDALEAQVRARREDAAAALTTAVARQLERVALAHAALRVVVAGPDGSDAQILFTPNPGQPEGPLGALASGGELSRVLLALSLETVGQGVVAVFDEIDAGLGGQVAQQIGECLAEVGRRQQVLAVTHLASVAARAHHHFVIEKRVAHGATTTSVKEVTGEERVDEIARMLAGDASRAESRALALQMLEFSSRERQVIDIPR